MSFDLWLAFLATSVILVMIPGRAVLPVLSRGLACGWRAALIGVRTLTARTV